MPIVSEYHELWLKCDKCGEGPGEEGHQGHTAAAAKSAARRAGWQFKRNGQTICPDCSGCRPPQEKGITLEEVLREQPND
jgi:hypothetical protein